jgi:hypothetical protein
MASPAKSRFAPRDPRKWTENTTRRRLDGKAEIAAWMDEIEEDYHEAVEMLEAIYREMEEDDAEMWDTSNRVGDSMMEAAS